MKEWKMIEWKMHDMKRQKMHILGNDRKTHLENEKMENAQHRK